MIELIIMMSIMALGVTAMFGVIGSGTDFAKDTEDTIKAINLAREGIE
jgi:type II secretory pathway pseudopilin PulG